MSSFIFKDYQFDRATGNASFTYGFDDGRSFTERVQFHQMAEAYNEDALDRALQLAFFVIGTSYFKTFPTNNVVFLRSQTDDWQALFLSQVYGEGLSQFAYENNLRREDLAQFSSQVVAQPAVSYDGAGILALQSGGKDSLLVATMLQAKGLDFTPWYVTSSSTHPSVLDTLKAELVTATRMIDHPALQQALSDGALNGHVPVTYIVQSLALVQAILLQKKQVLVSIAHEGEEPHAIIDDLAVTHQWSKTWQAEQLFADYVARYISPDLLIGSPLRQWSELKVAALFVEHAWHDYGHAFSSCNRANYQQGSDNSQLRWCGECPKCANSYLLFAPFVEASELIDIFGGQDLFEKPLLQQTFMGLLGVNGVMKPFECVGEIDELRYAYAKARQRGGYGAVTFDVPESSFDPEMTYPSQEWATVLL